ncbi:MAG TPA: FUSC family protein [Paenirhodobacter sp.]
MNALADLGFDRDRFNANAQLAVAACLAVLAGWLLGLEHPQWSGMTVWAVAQPTRGQLLEKGFFRFAGTISGTIAGVVLVLGSMVHPGLLVAGLALWVGACTLIGNLQRGLVSYGTVLAGYSAAMVALLDTPHPEKVFELGLDRMATVLTGVVVGMAVGYVFAAPARSDLLHSRLRAVLADLCERIARPDLDTSKPARQILAELAALEEQLDPHGAGSLRSRREVRATRAVLIAALALLLRPQHSPAAIQAAAAALRAGDVLAAARALPQDDTFAALRAALLDWPGLTTVQRVDPSPAATVVLHRDWIGAREAAIRATGAMVLFGGIWLLTGWSSGPYLLLGLSIMISLFSTFENPVALLPKVFLGQLCGVVGALICRWLVWPHAGSEAELIVMMMPFILFGAVVAAFSRTTVFAFDYNMVMLLMLQPHWPLGGSFSGAVMASLAIVAAPLTALMAYRTTYPLTLKRRLATLVAMMLNDLTVLAADPQALARRAVWRARLYHRTLRLVRLADRSAPAGIEAMSASLALLTLGHAAMRAHEIVAQGGPQARAAQAALSRLSHVTQTPDRARSALIRLGQRRGGADAALFDDAAARIDALPQLTP